MALPRITYDKNGRPRVAGRFVSARLAQQVLWANAGQIVIERVGGQTWYRGPDGTRVPKAIAQEQAEKHYMIGRAGKGRRKVSPAIVDRVKTRAPRGSRSAVYSKLHFNSAPRNALDFGAQGLNQYVMHGGTFYKVPPASAGALSDLFRTVQDRYIQDFKGLMDSPFLQVPFGQASNGSPVYNFDQLDLIDPELIGQVGEQAERVAGNFMAWLNDFLDSYFN